MGQQQLLLLVLGIVIVGLAVVVGIQAFSENMKKANSDALVNDAIRIASDAQAWRLKPTAFGGGAGNAAADMWDGLTLPKLGYTVNGDGAYVNLNGTITMTDAAGVLTITAINTEQANQVVVAVDGTAPGDITTTVSNYVAPV
jgi:hypothetical protein